MLKIYINEISTKYRENLPVTFIDMNFKIDVSVSSVPDQLFTIHVILHKATI